MTIGTCGEHGHDDIAYIGNSCPACAKIQEMDDELIAAQGAINDLDVQISVLTDERNSLLDDLMALETQIANLQSVEESAKENQ